MSTINDFNAYNPTWCPGCGNFGIGVSVKSALVQLNLDPSSIMVSFGIGCSGNMNDFLNAYAVHSLHGRSIPTAIGMKLTNHKMPVLVIAGDGDCYGEGGNHFIHGCRGNHDITVITHDNSVYGLTTGQVAPTAKKGYKSKSTPAGILEVALNPLSLALVMGATFVAQSFAGDARHTTEMIKQGIEHKGFSLVNILQPCVTFNKVNTYQYYLQKSYKLDEKHDKTNKDQAVARALELDQEKFPLGVLYQVQRPTFHEQLPQLADKTLIEREQFTNLAELAKDFI